MRKLRPPEDNKLARSGGPYGPPSGMSAVYGLVRGLPPPLPRELADCVRGLAVDGRRGVVPWPVQVSVRLQAAGMNVLVRVSQRSVVMSMPP